MILAGGVLVGRFLNLVIAVKIRAPQVEKKSDLGRWGFGGSFCCFSEC